MIGRVLSIALSQKQGFITTKREVHKERSLGDTLFQMKIGVTVATLKGVVISKRIYYLKPCGRYWQRFWNLKNHGIAFPYRKLFDTVQRGGRTDVKSISTD
jgi:hypothetical protein